MNLLVACGADARLLRSDFMRPGLPHASISSYFISISYRFDINFIIFSSLFITFDRFSSIFITFHHISSMKEAPRSHLEPCGGPQPVCCA